MTTKTKDAATRYIRAAPLAEETGPLPPEGEYQPIDPDEHGIVWSKVFPGLCLAVPALLDGKLAEVLATLQKGLASDEHAAFVARLAEKGSA